MRWLKTMTPLLLAAVCAGQSATSGGAKYVGTSRYGAVANATAGELVMPTLPQSWVNSHECEPVGGIYDNTVMIPGNYAATAAGVNQALSDWAAAPDQSWHVVIAGGTLISGSSSSNAGLIVVPVKAGATKCAVVDSSTPLPVGQTVCSHGIQDSGLTPALPDAGVRNPGCTSPNDVASMYTLEQTSANPVIEFLSSSTANPTLGSNHVLFQNVEIRLQSSFALENTSLVSIGHITSAQTMQSQAPAHVGLDRAYIHGYDTPQTKIRNGINWNCQWCWVTNTYIEKIRSPGAESHVMAESNAVGPVKIVHNWLEGASAGIFTGGGTPAILVNGVPDYGRDFEIRRNRVTLDMAYCPTGGVAAGVGVKNRLELKEAARVLVDGNIFENNCADGQAGSIVLLNVRSCSSGIACDNYTSAVLDITVSNNLIRHSLSGMNFDGDSGGASAGVSVGIGGKRWSVVNNLIYDIGDKVKYSGGASPTFGIRTLSGGAIWTNCNSSGDGTTATLTCLDGGTGRNQTNVEIGDPVAVTACGGFNTSTTRRGPGALAGTSGLTVVYPSSAIGTATGCSFTNLQGWPKNFIWAHNTFITDQQAYAPSSSCQGPSTLWWENPHAIGNTYKDSLFLMQSTASPSSYGWFCNATAEGTAAQNAGWDANTLTAHHLVYPGRTASVYTEYPGGGAAGISPPATMWFPSKIECSASTVAGSSASCVGVAGLMNGAALDGNFFDYHSYALDASSPYKAGGSRQASDGGDVGTNLATLDAAQAAHIYHCSDCGTPEFDDPVVPASLFGMHINSSGSLWPTVPFGSLRLIDDATAWPFLNGSTQGTYTWGNLDNWLSLTKTHGVTDLMYLMGRTPNWGSSNPTDTTCQYYNANPGTGAFAPGQCYPTSDLASGSSDAMWTGWAAGLANHINGLGASYSRPSVFEPWNEVTVGTSWKGTDAQLAQLTIDASATIKPILAGARVTSPTTVNWNPPTAKGVGTALTNIFNATPTLGASNGARTVANSVDILSFHSYMNTGNPEELINMAAMLRASVSAASRYALWDTEFSWGANAPVVTDEDLRAAYLARSYLVGYTAAGFQRMYWYGWDFSNTGNTGLATWTDTARCTQAIGSAGGHAWYLCRSGIAYQQVYSWMVGNTVTQASSGPMPVLGGTSAYGLWSCGLQKPDGTMLRVVWDTSDCMTVTLASCATTTYTTPAGTTGYYTLDDGSFTAASPGQVLTVGPKPIAIAWR